MKPSRDVDVGVDTINLSLSPGFGDLNAVEQTVVDLTKRIDAVLVTLGELEPSASVFFLELRRALSAARDEADLINTFIMLSTTAFQGFEFPPKSLAVIDELLADAERIAFTFTADGEAH